MDKPIAVLIAGLSVGLLVSSCESQSTTICTLECDCEHCNDIVEDVKCAEREADADVAEAYGCDSEWDDWATCYEEQGNCDEKEARYSTTDENATGSCTGEMNAGVPCPNGAADCMALGQGAECSTGNCTIKVCLGTNNPCMTNDQCQGGPGRDRCENEAIALSKCQTAASGHQPQQQPQPGGGGE